MAEDIFPTQDSKQVNWRFTPSEPLRLYQGDTKTELKTVKRTVRLVACFVQHLTPASRAPTRGRDPLKNKIPRVDFVLTFSVQFTFNL